MATKIENRKHSRNKIRWPVVVMTPHGLLDGKTENVSLGGAFICLPERPTSVAGLSMVVTAEGRLISLTAEVAWSDTKSVAGQTKFRGIGVRFTKIMVDDRRFISSVISRHA
jgi:hypothetical protein